MKKTYFNSFDYLCLDNCLHLDTQIGSIKCQECKHNKGIDLEEDWVKCSLDQVNLIDLYEGESFP